MKRYIILMCLFTAYSCSQKSVPPPLEYVSCTEFGEDDSNPDITCGFLTVPEDHSKPSDRKIKIAFAIKKCTSDTPGYPTLYLTGGPGEPALSSFARFQRDDLLSIGDVILVDQRGMGYSSALPNIGPTVVDILAENLNFEEEKVRIAESMNLMKQKADSLKIDLAKYNSNENAKDFGLLMDALGYKKYNLWGGSYGTRLGAFIMKYFPEKINAAALTAPASLDNRALINRIPDFTNALNAIVSKCSEDPICSQNHKDLQADIMHILSKLENDPVTVSIANKNFTINPQDAVFLIRYMLYNQSGDKLISRFVKALQAKDKSEIEVLASNAFGIFNSVNITAFYSFEAYEEYDTSTTIELLDETKKSDIVSKAGLAWFQSFIPLLVDWHQGRVTEEENLLQNIKVPTLVVANAFDPTTPPKNAGLYEQAIDPCYIINLANVGHGAFNDCISRIRREFLSNPNQPISEECIQ